MSITYNIVSMRRMAPGMFSLLYYSYRARLTAQCIIAERIEERLIHGREIFAGGFVSILLGSANISDVVCPQLNP